MPQISALTEIESTAASFVQRMWYLSLRYTLLWTFNKRRFIAETVFYHIFRHPPSRKVFFPLSSSDTGKMSFITLARSTNKKQYFQLFLNLKINKSQHVL